MSKVSHPLHWLDLGSGFLEEMLDFLHVTLSEFVAVVFVFKSQTLSLESLCCLIIQLQFLTLLTIHDLWDSWEDTLISDNSFEGLSLGIGPWLSSFKSYLTLVVLQIEFKVKLRGCREHSSDSSLNEMVELK